MSRTQVLLTKIEKLCSEIRAIKEENRSNKYSSKLPESRNNQKPQSNCNSAVLDTYDEYALHAHEPYNSMTNLQNHLSYNPDTPQGHEAPLAQTLSIQMPDLLNPSHASCTDHEDAATDPSELTERDRRGGMSGPLVDHLELWLAWSNAVQDQQHLVVSLTLFWQRCRWFWL